MKVGTVVQLNSGGPLMTIERIENDKAWCVWFDKSEKKDGVFPLGALVEYRDDY